MSSLHDAHQTGENSINASTILILGIGFGIAAERLIWTGGAIGIGFAIWMALFGIAGSVVTRFITGAWSIEVVTWSLVAFVAALTMVYRTTPIIILVMWMMLILSAALVYMHRQKQGYRESTVIDYLSYLIKVPLRAAFAMFPVLANIDFRSGVSNPRVWAVVRGVLLATPVLLLFILLFSSADATFSRYALSVTDLFSPQLVEHMVIIGVFSWLATGLFYGISEGPTPQEKSQFSFLKMGTDDTAVFMGLVVALFLAFVFFQLGYLFGGRETIVSTTGLTLAEYARRGFFELVIVSGLTLALLIAISNTGCNQRVFRPSAGILVVCVLIILTSAAQRLSLYINEFGLTIDRLTAVAAMLWLTIGLLLFTATVLRGSIKDFAAGLTLTAIIIGFGLAFSNPAAVVAKINIERAVNDNKIIDVDYLTFLGSDAVPVIVKSMHTLPVSMRCIASTNVLARWNVTGNPNLTQPRPLVAWNGSHARARAVVIARAPELVVFSQACRLPGQP
jgi:hypothetical protein